MPASTPTPSKSPVGLNTDKPRVAATSLRPIATSNSIRSRSTIISSTDLPRGSTHHFHVVAANGLSRTDGGDVDPTACPAGATGPSGTAGFRQPHRYSTARDGIELHHSSPMALSNRARVPFEEEICLFAGNFEPAGWTFCHGQLVSISNFPVLFQAMMGTTFPGDGLTNFALPDLRGESRRNG